VVTPLKCMMKFMEWLSTLFIIVKDFCAAIKRHLKPFLIKIYILNNIRKMANDFEKLQVIICYFLR
jgi:hypothetical protein